MGRLRLLGGFRYLTLDPAPRLRRLRLEQEARALEVRARLTGPFGRLPDLPDSAYPPGAVPLDTRGIPGEGAQ